MAIITKARPLQPGNNGFIRSRLAQLKPKPAPHKRVALQYTYKRTPQPKLKLFNVTLWAASWGQDASLLNKTLRMLCYCRHNIQFDRIIHFSRTPEPFSDCPWETVIIPELDFPRWNIFVNRVVPNYIKSDFAMSVHEDGFPLHLDLWNPKFLEYDYIGAPWHDGTVGNGGFNIESKKMLKAKLNVPMTAQELASPSDTYVCHNIKKDLEDSGIRFAPTDLALKFSTETLRNDLQSFGFHGRDCSPQKYREGWSLIQRFEDE